MILKRPGHNLTHSLVEMLGQLIVTGEYGGDHPFPIEAELAKRWNTSRSITREAVKMLTAKGLLSARPRQGTMVEPSSNWNMLDPDVLRWLLERKFSLKLLKDFTQVRLAIEPTAAAAIAREVDPSDLAEIELAIERMWSAERGEADSLEADIAFHVSILTATRNQFFMQLKELINTALRISIRFTNTVKGVRRGSVVDHQKVLLAIKAGDADGAYQAMHKILLEVMALIEAAKKAERPPVAEEHEKTPVA